MELTDDARANLALRLLQSLKPPSVLDDADPGFEEEIQRRVEDYDAHQTTASTWDHVNVRLRDELRRGKPS